MKKTILLVLALLTASLSASAYDFMAGDLCYNINSDGTSVTVTYAENYSENNYSGLTTANIPETITNQGITYVVTMIDDAAFWECTTLTSVTIPNTVITIGEDAFARCNSLTSVTIGNSVTTIGGGAFLGCEALTSITIPNSVTSIGGQAFAYSNLDSIVIPKSVTTIEYNPVGGCPNLSSIVVESGNPKYDSRNNCNAIVETETNTLVGGCKSTVIPNTVTYIGFIAFEYCTGLTSLEIPNSVIWIGSYAFAACYNLVSVTIPNSVTTILNNAFGACTSLSSIEIPNSVTCISNEAFFNCSNLKSLHIPSSVTSIGPAVVGNCYNLNSITVDEGNAVYDSRDNCNAIITSETNTLLCGCKNSFIPSTVTSLDNAAFYGQTGLTSIVIPRSIKSLLGYPFYGCTGLETVSLPKSLNEISVITFLGCNNIKTIISHIQDPSTSSVAYYDYQVNGQVHHYLFEDINKDECILYVPKGTIDAYKSNFRWQNCINVVEYEEGDVNGDGRVNVSDVSALINMIMGITPMNETRADVNGDQKVNVSDVSALINIILGLL